MPIRPNTERVYAVVGSEALQQQIKQGIKRGTAPGSPRAYVVRGTGGEIGAKLAARCTEYSQQIPQLVVITTGKDLIKVDALLRTLSSEMSDHFGNVVRLAISQQGQKELNHAESLMTESHLGQGVTSGSNHLIGGMPRASLEDIVAATIPNLPEPHCHEREYECEPMSAEELAEVEAFLEKGLKERR